jgi:hypothetical protein
MAEYYVVRDKNTGLYFRGKGVNRWGKYYNQASIYRIKANAENTIKEVSWRGEQAEIVPIQIVETSADVVPKSEVASILDEIEKTIRAALILIDFSYKHNQKEIQCKKECYEDFLGYIAELKKKYTEGKNEH